MGTEHKNRFTAPLRVLVVEDNSVDLRMLESMLTESSHFASFLKLSRDLNSAINILNTHEFDVVVLDLNLPDSQGVDTLKELNKHHQNVSIVVNTGAYEDELGLETLSCGAQDFLVKGKYNAYVLNKVLHYAVERKRLEMELVNAYDQLKETQSQLIQSEKLKVVGGLASGVAHEVKNPLATILYGVTFLAEEIKIENDKYKVVIDNIKEAAHRANDIVTDLLDFASLQKINKENSNLNDIVVKSIALINHEKEKKFLKLKKSLDSNLPSVLVDQNKIEQVIINILLNAFHATEEQGTISIKTQEIKLTKKTDLYNDLVDDGFQDGDVAVILTIEDTGCGITPEEESRIFDPFFTTRRGRGGIGLGLSVSKNIMEIHQGGLYVKGLSEGGARSTIAFRLT